MNKHKYTQSLEETIIRITAERDAALKRIQELEGEKEEIMSKLRIYENAHTPPSMQIVRKKKRPSKKGVLPKKRGAPKGHKGATRKRPVPDEVIHVIMKHCPKCNHKLGESIATETRVIEELPPPQKIKVTQYDLDIYKCPNCGLEVKAKHENCPHEGNFGIYLLVYITMLKFHLRGVIRKIRDFLAYNNSFEISVMGINNVLLRVGNACKGGYEQIIEKIRNAKWVYIDETGMKVNGEKWWLWIFRSPEGEVLVVIRKSRGSNVVREILGKDFKGAVIVDGWRAYNWIKIIQRCWAHLIREVDDFKEESKNGKRLSEDIHTKFDALKDFLDKDLPIPERKRQKEIFDKEMEWLVSKYNRFKELRKPLTYIKNGLGCWNTCLLYPGMEPTNNLGEQAMREHVIMRKIIGTFRSENGAKNYQYIASMLASWKLQGKDIFEELEELLRMELCLK
jgi:transposase-like protein